MISCQRKPFLVKEKGFLPKEIVPATGNDFLSKEMVSCQRKLRKLRKSYHVKENNFSLNK
jgi:hypothetical protein